MNTVETVKENWTTIAITVAIILGVYGFYAGIQNLSSLDLDTSDQGTVAELAIDSTISFSSGSYTTNTITPAAIRDLIQQAQQDDVDGYLFTINSGGGTVVASKQLGSLIGQIDEPTVCLMQEVAASGAIWIASECDSVVADPLTLTGSIGVTNTYLEFSGLLKEYGIEYVNLTAGTYKDAGSPYKNLTAEERSMLEDQLDTVHQSFKDQLVENTDINASTMEQVGEGQVFLGQEAQRYGLVDSLGGRDEAMDVLENMTGTNLTTQTYRERQGFSILSLLATKIGEGIGAALSSVSDQQKGITAVHQP